MKNNLTIIFSLLSVAISLATIIGVPLQRSWLESERKQKATNFQCAGCHQSLPAPVTTYFADGSSLTISYSYELR